LAAVDSLIGQGIPSIPIHDSILVPAQYEDETREALNFGWYTQNPSTTLCSIEKKCQKAPQYGCGCEALGDDGVLLGSSCVPVDGWVDVAEWAPCPYVVGAARS
jgi:hypothetical protein